MVSHKRVVSKTFADDLKHGKLSTLLARIKEDDTLMLALRNAYINIYYRGGNLLRIEQKGLVGQYIATFDTKYNKKNANPLPVQFPLYGCLPDSKQNLRYFVKKSVASLYSALFVGSSGYPDFALAPMPIR